MSRYILCPIQSLLLPFLRPADVGGKCSNTSAWAQWLPQSRMESIYVSRFVKPFDGLPLPSWHGGKDTAQSELIW